MTELPFCQMVRASGLAEPWVHNSETTKFDQFGWRCTTYENEYGVETLVGNYNEELYDIKQRTKAKPLSSQYGHYFDTTYDADFNRRRVQAVPQEVVGLKRRHPHSFPGHQPEFDTVKAKSVYNDWNTTSTATYKPPKDMAITQPITQQLHSEVSHECDDINQWQVTMDTTPITFLGVRSGPPATGGHVIAPPHAGPGTGAGAHQKSYKTTVGY